MSLPGVILAAGLSSRMGRPKALLGLGESTFLGVLADTFLEVCSPVIVVLGKDAERIAASLPRRTDVVPVVNENYESGMLSSLQTGLSVLPDKAKGAVFTLVDHPRLQVETLRAVVDAFERKGARIVIPRFNGKRGHPVAISAGVAAELIAAPIDGSPKDVIHAHRESTHYVDGDDPAIVEDIDTPEEYRKLSRN